MKTKPYLITNNQDAYQYCSPKIEALFVDGSYVDVLEKARDYIHLGHKLLSHPMAGSVKPNQTPYRSIILESLPPTKEELTESIMLIENSIAAAQKFLAGKAAMKWSEKIKKDFRTVDLSFISGYIDNLPKYKD